MRYMAESLVSSEESSFSRRAIVRRYSAQPRSSYFHVPRFKELSDRGLPEYRTLYMPSPFSCLAEAVILEEIGKDRAFGNHPSVYSYRWPSQGSRGSNYEHYFDNYQARNEGIASELTKYSDRVALVLDIRRFYPSADQEFVRAEFRKCMRASTLSDEVRAAADTCLDNTLKADGTGQGVPIGPELSHLLADLLLRNLDIALYSRFTTGYFRYVDDIVLVIHRSDIDSAITTVSEQLEKIGLNLNEEKTDVVEAADWLRFGPTGPEEVQELSVQALWFRSKAFIAAKPDRLDALDRCMREQGLTLPLSRLREHAAKDPWRERLKELLSGQWLVALSAFFADERSLVDYANSVKMTALRDFRKDASGPSLSGQIGRKWLVQKLRRNANQLFYLATDPELKEIHDATRQYTELHETSCVLGGLLNSEVTPLLDLPGPAIASYASLSRLRRQEPIRIPKGSLTDENKLEAIANLALYKAVANVPEIVAESAGDESLYLRFCAPDPAEHRELSDFSYLDEIRCLQLVHKDRPPVHMVETRFSDGEAMSFEALQLSGGYTRRGRI
jgi:Reverse transcriptase (RNA-dependent DNA polymerase)